MKKEKDKTKGEASQDRQTEQTGRPTGKRDKKSPLAGEKRGGKGEEFCFFVSKQHAP